MGVRTKSQAGAVGAQPTRGEREGSPLAGLFTSIAKQTDRDAERAVEYGEKLAMKKVTVQSIADHNYTMLINEGRHAVIADEPSDDGGDDLGPTPYELLLGAL